MMLNLLFLIQHVLDTLWRVDYMFNIYLARSKFNARWPYETSGDLTDANIEHNSLYHWVCLMYNKSTI